MGSVQRTSWGYMYVYLLFCVSTPPSSLSRARYTVLCMLRVLVRCGALEWPGVTVGPQIVDSAAYLVPLVRL